jgi:FkbM family methyltransferase
MRKRVYTPPSTSIQMNDKLWESLFTNDDSFIYNIHDEIKIILYRDSILCKNIYFGYEEDEIAFTRKYLKKRDIFFDIGANVGLYSLSNSKIVGDGGQIFAFEPTPNTFVRLQQNIQLNRLTNIQPFNIGLSNQKATMDLHISRDGHDAWNSFVITEFLKGTVTIKVNVDTLDSFLDTNAIRKVDLIKIDVEGWEKFVLQGANKLLQREDSPVFLIEFTETNTYAAGYSPGEIYDFMTDSGYKWYSYNSQKNKLIREKKKSHYPYENLIAVKNMEDCQKRIENVL